MREKHAGRQTTNKDPFQEEDPSDSLKFEAISSVRQYRAAVCRRDGCGHSHDAFARTNRNRCPVEFHNSQPLRYLTQFVQYHGRVSSVVEGGVPVRLPRNRICPSSPSTIISLSPFLSFLCFPIPGHLSPALLVLPHPFTFTPPRGCHCMSFQTLYTSCRNSYSYTNDRVVCSASRNRSAQADLRAGKSQGIGGHRADRRPTFPLLQLLVM